MSRPLSLFLKPQEDQNSRLMKKLLSLHEQQQENPNQDDYRPLSHREEPTHDPHQPVKRPSSANPLKRRLKSANNGKFRNEMTNKPAHSHAVTNNNSNSNLTAREDLLAEVHELKKKNLGLEEQLSFLKSENQRLESEAMKQQRRIDQLLNLSEGVKSSSANSQNIRREIEKSILVRQLKNQLNLLKTLIAEKESEIDQMKRDMRSTHTKEVEAERDEYYHEIQRLLKVIENLKAELSRERRRREWNRKLAGETGDDLRKELQRLASGYQTILTNLSTKNSAITGNAVNPNIKPGGIIRPSTASGARSVDSTSERSNKQRPQSANIRGKDFSNATGKSSNKAIDLMNPRPASPSDNWIDSFNLDSFNNNNNTTEGMPSENTFNSKGRPLAEYAQLSPSLSKNSNFGDNQNKNSKKSLEEDEDFEDGDEEELPSENIPVFNNNHPAPVIHNVEVPSQVYHHQESDMYDSKLHQYHTMDEREHQQHHLHHPPQPQPQQTSNQPKPMINHIMSTTGDAAILMPTDHPLGKGDRIQAEYRGKGRWYDGVIEAFDQDSGTYHILYDDGEEEKGVLPLRVRLISKARPLSKFSNGNKVEALYYNGKTWYKGEVKGNPIYQDAKQAYVYEIAYLDGEREKNVLEQNIRLLEESTTTKPAQITNSTNLEKKPPSSPQKNLTEKPVALYKVGEKVEGCFAENNDWYPATISSVDLANDGEITYSLLYDDGDTENNVKESKIRATKKPTTVQPDTPHNDKTVSSQRNDPEPASFKVNDLVEAYFAEYENWFRGRIMVINPPKSEGETPTYGITYDDGDQEKAVPSDRIRYFKKFSGAFNFQYDVNEVVEVRYRTGKEWYQGKVQAQHKDEDYGPVYDILYDDGDTEDKVKEWNIRLPPGVTKKVANTPTISSTDGNKNETKPSPTHQTTSSHKAAHVVSTNLDSFLNDLSDDEDEDTGTGGGLSYGLDAGKAVQLKSQQGMLIQETLAANTISRDEGEAEEEYNEEDFDA